MTDTKLITSTGTFLLNEGEAKELWEFIKHQHVSYDAVLLMRMIRRLGRFVENGHPDNTAGPTSDIQRSD